MLQQNILPTIFLLSSGNVIQNVCLPKLRKLLSTMCIDNLYRHVYTHRFLVACQKCNRSHKSFSKCVQDFFFFTKHIQGQPNLQTSWVEFQQHHYCFFFSTSVPSLSFMQQYLQYMIEKDLIMFRLFVLILYENFSLFL